MYIPVVYKMNIRGSIKPRKRVTEMSSLKIRTLTSKRVRGVVCLGFNQRVLNDL
jgi:hypothetical protein